MIVVPPSCCGQYTTVTVVLDHHGDISRPSFFDFVIGRVVQQSTSLLTTCFYYFYGGVTLVEVLAAMGGLVVGKFMNKYNNPCGNRRCTLS